MKQRLIVCIVGALVALQSTAKAEDQIPWIKDWRKARDLAQQQHRLVLLHFWSTTCGPCMRLERNVFNRPEVARAMTTGYVPVKINVDNDDLLAKHYRVQAVPTDVIVDANGKELFRKVTPQDPNQYIALLDGVKANYSVGREVQSEVASHQALAAPPSQSNFGGQAAAENRFTSGSDNRSSSFADAGSQAPQGQFGANPASYRSPYGNDQSSNQELSRYSSQASQDTGSRFGQQPTNNRQTASHGTPTQLPDDRHSGFVTNSHLGQPGPQDRAFQTQAPRGQTSAGQVPSSPALPRQPLNSQSPAGSPTFALEGYCPVTLVESQAWGKGDARFGAVHRGKTYLFTSAANQQRFLQNPDRYSPVLSGYDVVHYVETGQLSEGKRAHGVYLGNHFFLFANEAALQKFEQSTQQYLAALQQAAGQ